MDYCRYFGNSTRICTHKIYLKQKYVPNIEHQRHLNLPMKEVVNKEIIKLLDVGS